MKSPIIRFAELAADLPDLQNPGLPRAHNCVWYSGAYRPMYALSTSGSALTARCQGAFAGRDADGNTIIYAGDATKLYARSGSTWSDRSSATYTTQSTQYWKFRQYDSYVIATNFADTPQYITIGDGGNFADLAGADDARHIGIINQFVFLGDTNDATNGHVPHRVRWCAIGDPTDWPTLGTTDAADKQSDEEFLNSNYGKVMAIADGSDFGLVFQETAINRFTYVGGSAIFEVKDFEKAIGLFGPSAYAQIGNTVIFLAANGFYRTDGFQVIPIGTDKVDDLVLTELNNTYPERVSTAIDYANKLIYFSYPSNSSSDGTPDKLVVYNWIANRWTTGEQACELLFASKSLGYTLDELDDIAASLDDLPATLDSPIWTGGAATVGGFNTSHVLGSLNGSALTATIDTAESDLNNGGLVTITGIRPLVEGASGITITPYTRNLQTETATAGTATSTHSRTGLADMRVTARYHKERVTIPGGFTKAIGIQAEWEEAGEV